MIVCAHAGAIPLADETVQCVVTSPPYWGLRRYAGSQELIWGREAGCEHEWGDQIEVNATNHTGTARWNHTRNGRDEEQPIEKRVAWLRTKVAQGCICVHCGAWRGAYGLEPTIQMYVQHTVEILCEVRRVLRKDGVCFWNIGDSYAAARGYSGSIDTSVGCIQKGVRGSIRGPGQPYPHREPQEGLKPKDLCLIPSRVAIAAQEDGWWVRSMIIWAKPNTMPESVKDRPTSAYEYILVLTKAERYYWNADALAIEPSESSFARLRQPNLENQKGSDRVPGKANGPMGACFGGRNKHEGYQNRKHSGREDDGAYLQNGVNCRDVWVFSPQPYKGAHFATFPEELPRRCISVASRVGDLVLDPFGGSGTTGRVAIELRRRVVLCDLAYSHDYAPLAKERTSEVQLEAFA